MLRSVIPRAALFCRGLNVSPAEGQAWKQSLRMFKTRAETESAFGVGARTRPSLKERLMQPTTGLPFAVGRGVVIGASALGLGALSFYGLGMSGQMGALDRSLGWNELVKDRIRTSYTYLAGGLATTVASSVIVFRNPTLLRLASGGSIGAVLISMGAVMASGFLVQALPYQEGFGAKQLAFLGHSSLIGFMVAPLSFVGGQIIMRAAIYTAGIVGGLSTIALTAPSEKFLSWGAPLGMGMAAVLAANVGALFLPPTTAIGAGLASIVMYGGLVLFSGFLLYDTQKLVKKAETYPVYASRPFDPVSEAVHVYMDIMNIFIRIVMMLAGGGGNKRK